MERYIAVDNVCAWPNLTRMPDKHVVATIFNQPCHGKWEGDVECWQGDPEGRFWERVGVPAPHEPKTNRMNVAAGLARNGDLVVVASGWGGENFREHVLGAWVCRSSDGGRTWEHADGFPAAPGMKRIIPFGDIVPLDDGALGVSGYGIPADGDRSYASHFLRSRDDGRTWGEHAMIGEGINETAPVAMGGGRVLAAARANGGGHLSLFSSDDNGATWSGPTQITGPAQHPAHLLKLSDGRLVLTYGIRHRGLYGVGARISEDGGEAWYSPMVLVDLEDAYDGGYPASVELDDGSILTAYYASRVRAHSRYHMGVVRWSVEEMVEKNRFH